MIFNYQKLLSSLLRNINIQPKRPLRFYYLTVVWNSVDEDRIKELGPDKACAEWLLRNGASVRWKGATDFLDDYNVLQVSGTSQSIQAVYAEDASIHHIGFPHFSGCRHIDEIKLIKCGYIENPALRRLDILKDSLKHLEIIDCADLTDEGLKSLKNLTNLRILKLRGMPYVKDKSGVEKELSEALPNCTIEWK
ncbi:ATP synthase subunit s, mitochondrial [Venturia canescens]|uniref:ATP synthase subunit s, mitochondrial n=1 Tax=Venturia canescens TaxID=32260 RepID=UPI001C9BE52C|nr:ATP synthase subunit s, mitochondrial [Venturia canescens]